MTTGKQHYVFNFRNPGDDPSVTDWNVLFAENTSKNKANNKHTSLLLALNTIKNKAKNKVKRKAKSKDLSDVILKTKKSTKSKKPKANNEDISLNRFFSIVEVILKI